MIFVWKPRGKSSKKKSKLSSPILRKTKHHKDSSIAVADVGKLALIVLVGDVDGNIVEEASRAWHDVRGKLVLVQDGICLQGEEKKLGGCGGEWGGGLEGTSREKEERRLPGNPLNPSEESQSLK